MGVQNDSNFEGSVFEKSLNFHNKDKSIDDKLKKLPKSDGAWQKCIDDNIVPTNQRLLRDHQNLNIISTLHQ